MGIPCLLLRSTRSASPPPAGPHRPSSKSFVFRLGARSSPARSMREGSVCASARMLCPLKAYETIFSILALAVANYLLSHLLRFGFVRFCPTSLNLAPPGEHTPTPLSSASLFVLTPKAPKPTNPFVRPAPTTNLTLFTRTSRLRCRNASGHLFVDPSIPTIKIRLFRVSLTSSVAV